MRAAAASAGLTGNDVDAELLSSLLAGAAMFEPVVTVEDCGDPGGNKYLELALTAGAEVIVSGDADLLVLSPWHGIPVLTASGCLRALAERISLGQGTPDKPGM